MMGSRACRANLIQYLTIMSSNLVQRVADTDDETLPAQTPDDDVWSLLRATSRTFALSIEGLPAGLRDEVAVSYLLFRVSDYLEDHDELPRAVKVELLRLWDATLADPSGIDEFLRRLDELPRRPDDPEAAAAARAGMLLEATRAFSPAAVEAITMRVGETTRGMARRQEMGPFIENEYELDRYMHDVAGLVGYLVTDLFALRFRSVAPLRSKLMPLAREFGLALQTVNVLRGLRKDYERGWVFVPRTLCERYGLSYAEFFCPSNRRSAMRVVGALIEKAERHLEAGLAYVRTLPRHLHRVRLACMWPLLFAAGTLGVSRGNPEVLTGEVKIGRDAVKRIVRRTTLYGWSNAWLGGYTVRLLANPEE